VRRATFTIAALLAGLIVGCGGGGTKTSEIPAGGAATSSSPSTPTTASTAPSGCTKVPKPAAKKDGGQKKPSAPLASGKTYKLTVDTNCGSFTIQLDPKTSPNASASMVSLAKAGFFSNTVFHRIVTGFVVQGGDPTGTGTGGPGYKTVDKPPKDAKYTKGVVAMAKGGDEKPGTAGSQFYVVTGADAGLPPDYAVLGKVVAGMDVVERIGQAGSQDQAGTPTFDVVIKDVKVG
jgi:peptidyl-prolyl cis-trans isomerase B (cyclophilin B)